MTEHVSPFDGLMYAAPPTAGGAAPTLYIVDGDPNGILEAVPASTAINPANGNTYVKTDTDATSWVGGGGGGTGPQGPPGPTGPAGADGAAGAQGIQGIQGPQGDPGADGAQGIQGIQGVPGADGDDGAAGAQGIQGIQGIQGPQGDPGADGADGSNGSNGQGVPTGGATNQILAKTSGTDFATAWIDPPSGGSGLTQPQVMARSLGC